MGALVLAALIVGMRFSFANARVIFLQLWGGVQGVATDISIQAKEILGMKEKLNKILAHHTGQDVSKIEKDTDRDYFMSAEESKVYGIVDEVVANARALKK